MIKSKKKRTESLTIRLTEPEKEWISKTAKLNNKSITDLIIMSVCSPEVTTEYGLILRELKKIEQMLKAAENKENSGDVYEAKELINETYKNIMQTVCKGRN